MFSELTVSEKLGWGLFTLALVSLIIFTGVWTSNNSSNRETCLVAGGDWRMGSCILSRKTS